LAKWFGEGCGGPFRFASRTELQFSGELIAGAIELHLSGMRTDGEAVPEPSFFEMVEVAG